MGYTYHHSFIEGRYAGVSQLGHHPRLAVQVAASVVFLYACQVYHLYRHLQTNILLYLGLGSRGQIQSSLVFFHHHPVNVHC